jgi:immune inhibitor A
MSKKILGMAVALVILTVVAATIAAPSASAKGTDIVAAKDGAVTKLPPVAIGAHAIAGTHLVPPSRGALMAALREEGLPLDATPEQVQAAAEKWYARFQKQSDTWVNAEFQEWVQEREAELAAPGVKAMQIQPVTATVFAMAVDFGATETFTLPVEQDDGSCLTETVTITGPLNGLMEHPGAMDNFTLWYSPSLTSDASFYEKIIFGYEGAGRARMDLTDPDDGQPGINLAGLTVQDYYDNVAGDGNVYITGTVEGWVTVPHSEGYYGADNCATGSSGGGAGHPVATLVVDAAKVFSASHTTYYTDTSADAFWPKYDGNDDGVIDTFWIIHAGAGQEGGGGPEGSFAIWSHSSDIRHQAEWEDGFKIYEGDPMTTTDDIVIGPYTMQPENSETGVFAEEFGHNFFGLPDLYTSDASNSVGYWNIMSGGAWMGWLGGTRPASMPLWFKMIAAFDLGGGNIASVNWHQPMVQRDYDDPAADVTIGQLEKTPAGVNKGVRVDLPTYTLSVDNMAGTGMGAYSGTGRDETDIMLTRQVAVGAAATGTLTIGGYWDIEEDWDYGYVMVNGMPIADEDGTTTNFNPNGNNLGNGLTGQGAGVLVFDLSAYAGQTVTLTLRYKTDAAVTNDGWWVDNVMLDGAVVDDFETAVAPGTFPGWTNSDPGWFVVPTTATHERYYLVEWRTMTKYDQMIAKSAYIHNTVEPDYVTRIPYNMPAALLYYRDTQYGATYAMHGNASDPPSYGSKYQLLVVDQNWDPMRIYSGTVGSYDAYEGYWTGRISSYDSALTLQDSDPFTIPTYYGIPDLPAQVYPSKPAVTKFNDANGYYAGYWLDWPYVPWHERDGSAVIPARGLYSVRLTDFNGDKLGPTYDWLYGYSWAPSWFGDGKPGTDNVQFGVDIELLSKAGDDAYNSTAVLRFSNQDVVVEGTVNPTALSGLPGDTYTVTYETVLENRGAAVSSNVLVTYTLDSALTAVSLEEENDEGTLKFPPMTAWWTDGLAAGETITLTLVATGTVEMPDTVTTWLDVYDGNTMRGPWSFDTSIATYKLALPLVFRTYAGTPGR